LVVNGDFEDGSTGWELGGGNLPVVENGLLKFSLSSGTYSRARQNNSSIIGNVKITYTVVNSNIPTLLIRDYGGGNAQNVTTTIGTHTIYRNFTDNGINFHAVGVDGGILEISDISVKEVISATNTPRLDYSTGAEAFLLEPQSTNLIPHSSDFSQWNLSSNASVNANQTISPDGTQNAYLLNSTQASSRVQVNLGNLTGVYAQSIYLKYAGDDVLVRLRRNQSNDRFDLIVNSDGITAGTVDSGVIEYSIEAVGNDWYRVWNTQNNLTWYQLYIDASGNGGSIYAYGAQLEALPYASSLIPSNGSQTTRNQELSSKNNVNELFDGNAGSIYLAYDGISSNGTTLNNMTPFRLYGQSDNKIRLYYAPDADFLGTSINFENGGKIAWSCNGTTILTYVNGVLIDTHAITNNFTTLSNFALSTNFMTHRITDIKIYPKALLDAELINLTTI